MSIDFKQCIHTYLYVKMLWHRSRAPFLNWLKQQTIQKMNIFGSNHQKEPTTRASV